MGAAPSGPAPSQGAAGEGKGEKGEEGAGAGGGGGLGGRVGVSASSSLSYLLQGEPKADHPSKMLFMRAIDLLYMYFQVREAFVPLLHEELGGVKFKRDSFM